MAIHRLEDSAETERVWMINITSVSLHTHIKPECVTLTSPGLANDATTCLIHK